MPEKAIRDKRHELKVTPVYKRVDTCAAEFATSTAYLYSTYEEECEAQPSSRRKIMILGGGPNRIGQGIEFDYCCVHAALQLREDGFETIMVNCNPETVSTDYDTSDRLYFEPLTLEDVLEVLAVEKPEGRDRAVRRADPAEAVARARGRRGADHRHLARLDRRRRGPRALPGAGAQARTEAAGQRHRAQRGAGRAAGARGRLPARGAPLLRARRPRHGGGVHGGGPAPLHDPRRAGLQRQPGAARPLPRRRHRGGRGRGVRRGGRADRRHHGAHRAGRRALGRLLLLAAAEQPQPRDAARAARADAQARPRPERRRPHEHPVRDPGRSHLRAGGESARLAHRAVRLQGHRAAARQDRRARHERAQAQAARRRRGARAGLLLGQGGRVPVREVPRGRPDPRPGDEVHRRGHGDRAHLRRGLCEGPGGLRGHAAAPGRRLHQRARSRQGSGGAAGAQAPRARLRTGGHRRYGALRSARRGSPAAA